eukprot:scaffold17457_cov105-Isochrysis_galbana.AAC.11
MVKEEPPEWLTSATSERRSASRHDQRRVVKEASTCSKRGGEGVEGGASETEDQVEREAREQWVGGIGYLSPPCPPAFSKSPPPRRGPNSSEQKKRTPPLTWKSRCVRVAEPALPPRIISTIAPRRTYCSEASVRPLRRRRRPLLGQPVQHFGRPRPPRAAQAEQGGQKQARGHHVEHPQRHQDLNEWHLALRNVRCPQAEEAELDEPEHHHERVQYIEPAGPPPRQPGT